MKIQEKTKEASKTNIENPIELEDLLIKRKLQNKVLKKIANHLVKERNEIKQKINKEIFINKTTA